MNKLNFRKNLSSKFSKLLEFELGPLKVGALANPNLIKPFANSLFFRFNNSPLISDLSLFYVYFNDYSLDVSFSKNKSFNAVDLFFNDIFALDELIDSKQLQFKNYRNNWDRAFPFGKFHADGYPFYDPNSELDDFLLSFNASNEASWAKFPSSSEKPYSLFLEQMSGNKNKLSTNKFSFVEFKRVMPYYYLTKVFMSVLMDEERYYSVTNLVKPLLILIIAPLAIYLFSLHSSEFFYWTFHKRYAWIGTDPERFWLDFFYMLHHPIDFILRHLWLQFLFFKMTSITFHDAIIYHIFKYGPKAKRLKRRLAFFFANRKRRRHVYGKILYRWFW